MTVNPPTATSTLQIPSGLTLTVTGTATVYWKLGISYTALEVTNAIYALINTPLTGTYKYTIANNMLVDTERAVRSRARALASCSTDEQLQLAAGVDGYVAEVVNYKYNVPAPTATAAVTCASATGSACLSSPSSSSDSSSSSLSTGAIVGISVGGVAAVGIAAGAIYYFAFAKQSSLASPLIN